MGNDPSPLSADDARLLAALAKSSGAAAASPHDLERLDRLVEAGYLVKDPAMKQPRFRLTIRGWGFVRHIPSREQTKAERKL